MGNWGKTWAYQEAPARTEEARPPGRPWQEARAAGLYRAPHLIYKVTDVYG